MFKDPSNADRAAWAQAAVDGFRAVCRGDREDDIKDLICNLLHLARRRGHDPQGCLNGAMMHFDAEEMEAREIGED